MMKKNSREFTYKIQNYYFKSTDFLYEISQVPHLKMTSDTQYNKYV